MSKPPRRRPADTSEHTLSVYDGRRLIGYIIDLDGRHQAHAFDANDRVLGVFGSRKIALAAVSARAAHDAEAGR